MDPNILEQLVLPILPVRSNLNPERTVQDYFFPLSRPYGTNRTSTALVHPDAAVGVWLGELWSWCPMKFVGSH